MLDAIFFYCSSGRIICVGLFLLAISLYIAIGLFYIEYISLRTLKLDMQKACQGTQTQLNF